MSSTSTDTSPHVVEDCRGILRVLSDGTILRSTTPLLPSLSHHDDPSVQWKDAVYDQAHNLRLRMYKPSVAGAGKLPVLVYFHGGGFCIGSCAWPVFHAGCTRLAADLPAIVISFDYRLAPEHRLPAAIDDAATALLWFRAQATGNNSDPWLAESADLGRVFVSGESAGGNMSHHMAARFGTSGLGPVCIRGFIQLMPFFLGAERTPSELECPTDAFLNWEMCDRYARLALPVGAGRDHPVFNPFGPESPSLARVDMGPMLVVAAGCDILRDRNVEYARQMREMGKRVELAEFPGQEHAFLTLDPGSESVHELIRVMKRFMDETCSS